MAGDGHKTGLPTHDVSSPGGNAALHGTWLYEQSRRIIPWELSCLAIFTFSIVLLVSAWLDLRDDQSWLQEDGSEDFGEKGEIHL